MIVAVSGNGLDKAVGLVVCCPGTLCFVIFPAGSPKCCELWVFFFFFFFFSLLVVVCHMYIVLSQWYFHYSRSKKEKKKKKLN